MVTGAMLVDTGATSTCMSRKAADALGLSPLRMQKGYGAGGAHDNPVYFAALEIPIPDGSGAVSVIGWEQEVQGIPDLEKHAQGSAYGGNPVEVIGLLGRDILRFATMSYDGPQGSMKLRFDVASLQFDPSRGPL